MIVCHPQAFLLAQDGSLERLKEKYAIDSKWHPTFKNLVQLKYNQIESPMKETIVQQCRGIILDASKHWGPVAWPFDKFFNYGEVEAADVKWASSSVQEKIDGTLCIMYFYDKEWRVATSGMPDAGGEVNGCGFTFAQLFWSVFKEKGYTLPSPQNCNLTFLFELTTPYNRVVVNHKKSDLVLTGIRSLLSGHEMQPDVFEAKYDVVTEFNIWSLEKAIETFNNMNPLQQEGYVVVDTHFNRIKIKHPGYVAIHHLKDGFGPKRIVEVIQKGETSELLAHFPEWKPMFERVQRAYDDLCLHLHVEYQRLWEIPDQKAFAFEVVKTRYPAALFMMRSGKASSIKDALSKMTSDKLYDLLGVGDVEVI